MNQWLNSRAVLIRVWWVLSVLVGMSVSGQPWTVTFTPSEYTSGPTSHDFNSGNDLSAGYYRLELASGAMKYNSSYGWSIFDAHSSVMNWSVTYGGGGGQAPGERDDSYGTAAAASAASQELSVSFHHSGGVVSMAFADTAGDYGDNSGQDMVWRLVREYPEEDKERLQLLIGDVDANNPDQANGNRAAGEKGGGHSLPLDTFVKVTAEVPAGLSNATVEFNFEALPEGVFVYADDKSTLLTAPETWSIGLGSKTFYIRAETGFSPQSLKLFCTYTGTGGGKHKADKSGSPVEVCPDMQSVSAGDCGCDESCVGQSSGSSGCLDFRIGLGLVGFGEDAGYLLLLAQRPTAGLAKPDALQFFMHERLRKDGGDFTGTGHKIVANTTSYGFDDLAWGRATLTVNSAYKYTIVFEAYDPSDLSYDTYRTLVVENPDGATSNDRVYISETMSIVGSGSRTRVWHFEWDPTSGLEGSWVLKEGEDVSGTVTYLRVTERAEDWNAGGDEVTETVTISPDGGAAVSKVEEVYHVFDWGREMTSRTVDPDTGGAQLKEVWTYYYDAANDGDNYGRVESYLSETGYWERYEYDSDGNVAKTMRQYGDEALSLATAFATAAADNIVEAYTEHGLTLTGLGNEQVDVEKTVIKVEGTVVRTSYMIYRAEAASEVDECTEEWSVRCINADPETGGTTSLADVIEDLLDGTTTTDLVTKTWRWEAGATGIGDNEVYDVRAMRSPDGQVTVYERSESGTIDKYLTTVVRRGYSDDTVSDIVTATGGADIEYGTKTTSVTDARGNRVSTLTERVSEDANAGAWFIVSLVKRGTKDEFGRPLLTDYYFGEEAADELASAGTGTKAYDTLMDYGCCGGGDSEKRAGRDGVVDATYFDILGRVEKSVRAEGAGGEVEDLMVYDAAGRVTKSGVNENPDGDDDLSDSDDISTSFAYDLAGRQTVQSPQWDGTLDRDYYTTYRRVTATGGVYGGSGVFYWETRRYGPTAAVPVQVTWTDSHGRAVLSFSGKCSAYTGTGGVPAGTEALTEQARTVMLYDWADRPTETRTYFSFDDGAGTLSIGLNDPGSAGTNYIVTSKTEYDVLGRAFRRTDAAGNITQTVYEGGTGRAIKTMVGIDAGDLHTVSRVYYQQFVGGNPTGNDRPWPVRTYTLKPNLTSPPNDADLDDATPTFTDYVYNEAVEVWDVATKTISTVDYDYVTGSEQWSRPQYGPWSYSETDVEGRTAASGTAKNGSASYLLTRAETTYYDTTDASNGHVQHADRLIVNSGSAGTDKLRTTSYYDDAGRQVKAETAGRGFTKTAYDVFGRREREVYASAEGTNTEHFNETSGQVIFTDDIVLTETVYKYEETGQITQVTRYDRAHDATAGGLLSAAAAGQSRPSHTVTWYDANGRQEATGHYGTNGYTAFTRPATVPGSPDPDVVLVAKVAYDDAGRAHLVTDPEGKQTRTYFDAMGRVTYTVENYKSADMSDADDPESVSGSRNADVNRVTKRAYDNSATAGGVLKELTAFDPAADGAASSGDDQVTHYIHSGEVTASQRGPIRANGRRVATAMPDGAARAAVITEIDAGVEVFGDFTYVEYYADGSARRVTDPRGVQVQTTYTNQGWVDYREVGEAASNTWDSTGDLRIAYTYGDAGEALTVTTYSVATGGDANRTSKISYTYDGFYNITAEAQDHDPTANGGAGDGKTLSWSFDPAATGGVYTKAYRPDKVTYPNGRVLQLDYSGGGGIDDAIGRASQIEDYVDGTSDLDIVSYAYLGSGAMVRKDYPTPNVRVDFVDETGEGSIANDPYDASWDRFGRPVRYQWERYDGSGDGSGDLIHIAHGYDGNSNRLYDDRQAYNAHSKVFTWDGLDRIKGRDEGVIGFPSGVPTIDAHWTRDGRDWTLDQVNNPTQVDTDFDTDRYGVEVNKANELTKLIQDADAGMDEHDATFTQSTDEGVFTTQINGAGTALGASDVVVDTLDDQLDITAGSQTSPSIVLMAPELGAVPVATQFEVGSLAGTGVRGLVGYVFGYKSKDDYWVLGKDMSVDGTGDIQLYHMHDADNDGTLEYNLTSERELIATISSGGGTPSAGTSYPITGHVLYATLSAYTPNANINSGGGFPGGRVGLYTELSSASFDYLTHAPTNPRYALGSGWVTDGAARLVDKGSGDGAIELTDTWHRMLQPVLLEHVRAGRFEVVFSATRAGSDAAFGFVFSHTGPGDFDMIGMYHAGSAVDPAGLLYASGKARTVNNAGSGAGTAPNTTTAGSASTKVWYKLVSDGSTISVYTSSTSTFGGTADQTFTNLTPTVGRIGFVGQLNTAYIDDVTVKTDPDNNGSFDKTETVAAFGLTSGEVQDSPAHDAAGNLVFDGARKMSFDAFNRLVRVENAYGSGGSSNVGSTLAAYRYDGRNRRIEEAEHDADGPLRTLHPYYTGWSVVETRDGSDRVLKQQVWDNLSGGYVDSLAEVAHNPNPDTSGSGDNICEYRLYALQDQQFNVLAVITPQGDVAERYEYGLYGQRRVFRPGRHSYEGFFNADFDNDGDVDDFEMLTWLSNYTGSGGSGKTRATGDTDQDGDVDDFDYGALNAQYAGSGVVSTNDPLGLTAFGDRSVVLDHSGAPLCDVGFTGKKHDEVTGLVYFPARGYDPETGRFLQIDPSGYPDGMNSYAGYHAMYGGVDPSGMRYAGPAMDGGYESSTQASQMSTYDYNQKVKEDKRAAAAASDPTIAARHGIEENRRLWSSPNSTITGPGLARDFYEGIGPEKRLFKDGDYLTGVLQEHEDIKQARLEARVSAKIYCEGNYWEDGLPHGRIDTRPDNRDWNGFMYAFADIPSMLTGGWVGTQEDIAYLGTLHGIWRITNIDCGSCKATVKFKLENRMGLKSGTYGALEDVPQDPNQPRQPFTTIEQEWEWYEDTPFKTE